ncbi:cysteine desulfurase family protein [Alicyclobacillus acidocaldarius]|uniref:Cysteine desulfurase n=1 Tax=Alicyclobacillus acidocaldarius subsp. acidocaldarius (strain ATCC 27009 / DSM 446 / BCRC 14685 / JCM 5260 / KCTC 1825 / NBRC 15652 / NCIMB 11725 / NRRL B-14509 / 104-IA) TaxID=521098 RepID=C8WW18_ALIAD|nr:cysteine desulfurase family protein [Alicyclobacillus acidocaldarius]ACV58290.1 Cysteine desulfurase [Alicyclobacillus acidocaldarius subsp. acidocaldarius DSM 446]
MADELYFDYAATAPVRPEVRERMAEWLDIYGNPSSLHRMGMRAERALRHARDQVMQSLGARDGRLVFTGGGTEANNLAIYGVARAYANRGRHLVTTAIEHPAVREAMGDLEREGFDVSYVRPDHRGDVSAEDVLRHVRDDTVLVSVMHVNNETGAVLPVEQIADKLKAHPKVVFHVDGTQALGKIPVSLARTRIHLYAASGHKLGALKGVGALYVHASLRLKPHVVGGGQEFGLRSGTENVLGALSFGEAALHAVRDMENDVDAERKRDRLARGLEELGYVLMNPKHHSPYILCAALPGARGEILVHAFEEKGLYVSAGSACSSGKHGREPSHVLTAMGVKPELALAAIRFSWHPGTRMSEIEHALEVVRERTAWIKQALGIR